MTAQEYLQEHGITQKGIEMFQLTYDDSHISIPVISEDGTTSFIKSRNLDFPNNKQPKYKNSVGSKATLFNYHNVQDSPHIVICEGEIDCIKLNQEGIPAITSTGGASTFLDEWGDYLTDKETWICLDNDDAGHKGTYVLLSKVPHAKVIELPEGVKDVCEFFQISKKQDFLHLMATATEGVEWEMAKLPKDYSMLSMRELSNMEFEEHPWLIDNVLYSQGFCFLYGSEGTGKSFVTLSMAKAVASGQDWLGQYHVPNAVPVLILDKENPLSMLKRRIKGLGMDEMDNVYVLQYPEKFKFAEADGSPSDFATTLTTMITRKKIGLIIFDSFVDFVVGSENSAQETQMFFDGIRVLYPRIAYLPIHHENKPTAGISRSSGQKLRGSSNINAQTFTMFRLEAVGTSKTDFTLQQTKNRDAQKLDKFMVRRTIKTMPNGKTEVSGFEFVGVMAEGVETDPGKRDEAQEAIKNLIKTERLLTRKEMFDLLKDIGISETTARRAIKELLDEGTLGQSKRGREIVYGLGMFNEEILDNEDLTEIFDGNL